MLYNFFGGGGGGGGGYRGRGKGMCCGNVRVKIMSFVSCFKSPTCLLLSVVVEVTLHPRIYNGTKFS